MHLRVFVILLFVACWSLTGFAQEYQLHTDSEALVEGTSNIKDWTAKASGMSGELTVDKSFVKKGPGKGGILTAELKIPVDQLDGGRGETMNAKILKAFSASENPDILYRLSSGEIYDPANDKTFKMRTSGELVMAGQTKPVSVEIEGKQTKEGKLIFSGSHKINMTEWGMVPPTAMFGQIEAGEWVTVNFTWVFEPNE